MSSELLMLVINFLISFVAGGLFWFFFTHLPHRRKKASVKDFKDKTFDNIVSDMNWFLQEGILCNKTGGPSPPFARIIYTSLCEAPLSRKYFVTWCEKHGLNAENFFKIARGNVNSAGERQAYREFISMEERLNTAQLVTLEKLKGVGVDYFTQWLGALRIHSDVNVCDVSGKPLKVIQFLKKTKTDVLRSVEALESYLLYMEKEEMVFLTRIKNLDIFSKVDRWPLEHIDHPLSLHAEALHEFFVLECELSLFIEGKKMSGKMAHGWINFMQYS